MLKYFGYGAMIDVAVVESVIERTPTGVPGTVHNMRLCIQELKDMPAATQEILMRKWPSGFRSYTISPGEDSTVSGVIWDITEEERAVITAWELIDTGWYTIVNLDAQSIEGETVTVTTEVMGPNQTYSSVANGEHYPALLNAREDHTRVAKAVREGR